MKLYDFYMRRLYPVSKDKIFICEQFCHANCVSSTQIYITLLQTGIYINFSFHFLIYFFICDFHISHIFLHFGLPIYVTQPPTIQLSHLQWLLGVLIVSSLSIVSGYWFQYCKWLMYLHLPYVSAAFLKTSNFCGLFYV